MLEQQWCVVRFLDRYPHSRKELSKLFNRVSIYDVGDPVYNKGRKQSTRSIISVFDDHKFHTYKHKFIRLLIHH